MGCKCPNCDEWFEIIYDTGAPKPSFCPMCGHEAINNDEWKRDDEPDKGGDAFEKNKR